MARRATVVSRCSSWWSYPSQPHQLGILSPKKDRRTPGHWNKGMMNRDFPHLLVATEFSPNASGGGPAVVRQMLKHWPSEKISWWSCLPEKDKRFGQMVHTHKVA